MLTWLRQRREKKREEIENQKQERQRHRQVKMMECLAMAANDRHMANTHPHLRETFLVLAGAWEHVAEEYRKGK